MYSNQNYILQIKLLKSNFLELKIKSGHDINKFLNSTTT